MKKILISAVAVIFIVAAAVGVICVRDKGTETLLAQNYSAKVIDGVELNKKLKEAVDKSELSKVKVAVLENKISEENQEKLVPMIEKYGVNNTLSGYAYLNSDYITWKTLENFIEIADENGLKKAIKEHEKNAAVYTPSTFKRSKLEEWINVKGYPASDITAMDKLSKMCGADFDGLMERYESGESIGKFKAELGLVNINPKTEYVTIDENDVKLLARKFSIEEKEAAEALAELVRLKFDTGKLEKVKAAEVHELFAAVLEEKYGGDRK